MIAHWFFLDQAAMTLKQSANKNIRAGRYHFVTEANCCQQTPTCQDEEHNQENRYDLGFLALITLCIHFDLLFIC